MNVFTKEELKEYDGRNGSAYIAFEGKVYDVSQTSGLFAMSVEYKSDSHAPASPLFARGITITNNLRNHPAPAICAASSIECGICAFDA